MGDDRLAEIRARLEAKKPQTKIVSAKKLGLAYATPVWAETYTPPELSDIEWLVAEVERLRALPQDPPGERARSGSFQKMIDPYEAGRRGICVVCKHPVGEWVPWVTIDEGPCHNECLAARRVAVSPQDPECLPVPRELLEDLVDTSDCSFDHHGMCQAHMWDLEPGEVCGQAQLKALLAAPVAVSPTTPEPDDEPPIRVLHLTAEQLPNWRPPEEPMTTLTAEGQRMRLEDSGMSWCVSHDGFMEFGEKVCSSARTDGGIEVDEPPECYLEALLRLVPLPKEGPQ